ncbi:MAG: hypothetical protein EA397_13785 [Deltaproteobacteria bacterium]|nr:MAG: hypothetical protein EA397_13785 [Deltaproteobacteria bacterium]
MLRSVPLLLLAACSTPLEDEELGPYHPTVPTSACVDEPYDWVDLDEMGSLIEVREAQDLSFPAPVLDIALRSAGLGDYTPVPYGVVSFRVRYLTQDKGRPIEATAILSFPQPREDGPLPSVPTALWGHGTTGFTDACAPSAGGVEEGASGLLPAAHGFATAAPDYIGMNGFGEPAHELHPYLVAEPAAVGALDSVRALWRLAKLRDDLPSVPTPDLLLWGVSEGGFTVLHADRFVTHYLPEANPIGTIASVPPTDLEGITREALTEISPATGGLVGGMVGMASWHGDLELLGQVLRPPLDRMVYEEMSSSCNPGRLLRGYDTLDAIFTEEVLQAVVEDRFDDFPPFSCYMREGSLLTSQASREHDAPVFLQISGADELVLASVERENVPRLCEAGYAIDYLECEGADHVRGAVDSLPAQLNWAMARAAGEPVGPTCQLDRVVDCSSYDFR